MMIFSWRELPPTPGQILAITRMCMALRIRPPLEELPRNRMEARNLMYDLRARLRGKPRSPKCQFCNRPAKFKSVSFTGEIVYLCPAHAKTYRSGRVPEPL